MPPKGAYTLVVEDRFGALTDEYSFDSGELVIGRSRQCDIVLSSENVSRRHARIWSTANGLVIEDLQSANGAYVNGRRISEPTELSDQDVVRMGDFHLHIRGGRKQEEDRPVHLRLVGLNLTVAEQVFEVTTTTTLVGRGKDCGLVLVDPSISRVHARVLVRPDSTVLVEDVGSANGVCVNGKRVKVWQVSGGDRVKFGNVEFLVEIPSQNTSETPGGAAGALRRVGARLRENLPWVVAAACAGVVIVLLILLVPEYLNRGSKADAPAVAGTDAAPAAVPAATSTPADVGPPAPVPPVAVAPAAVVPAAAADRLALARKLLAEAKIEEAANEVGAVLADDPANLGAVQLMNRLEMERAAGRAASDADAAVANHRFEDAVAALLKVPEDSVFHEQSARWLARLQPEIEKLRKKACRPGQSIDCIRLKALAGKLERAL